VMTEGKRRTSAAATRGIARRRIPRLQAARGFDMGRGWDCGFAWRAGRVWVGLHHAMVGLSRSRGAKLATKNGEGVLECRVVVMVDRRDLRE
jgi:hypothetical protein